MDSQWRIAWSAAWGVLVVALCGGAFATWTTARTPGSKFPLWPSWVLAVTAVMAVYMLFAYLVGLWPVARRTDQTVNVDLITEQVGDDLHLVLVNRGPAAEFSAQVTAVISPMGDTSAPQSWTIAWLEDNSTGPKRIFTGARQVLNLAKYNADAVNALLSTGQDGADHWLFPTAPAPIGKKYYNLLRKEDLDLQRFMLDVRIMNANSRKFLDRQLIIGIQDGRPICEIVRTITQ